METVALVLCDSMVLRHRVVQRKFIPTQSGGGIHNGDSRRGAGCRLLRNCKASGRHVEAFHRFSLIRRWYKPESIRHIRVRTSGI